MKLINSNNERYLILDKETLVHIGELNLNSRIIAEIEDTVLAAFGNKALAEMPRLNIHCSQSKSNIRLTHRLTYAILNKYGTSPAVTITSLI